MTRYVLRDGELVDKATAPPLFPPKRGLNSTFNAMRDIEPFVTTDGTEITSRSGLREYERANGVRQTGNDWTGPERPSFHEAVIERARRRERGI